MRLTARARLTVVYTGLFALAGGILVSATYLLVAQSLKDAVTTSATTTKIDPQTANFIEKCTKLKASGDLLPPDFAAKCAAVYQLGVRAGVQVQSTAVLHDLLLISLVTLGVVLVLAAVGGWLLAGRILRPLHQITAAARAASEQNLSGRVALRGPRDELRELADTFDEMLDRLQAAFAGQSRFIANASHELRTPLTTLRTTVDVVLAKPEPSRAELIDMAVDVRQAVDEAGALIDALLTLARHERGLTVHERVNLAGLVRTACADLPSSGLAVDLNTESAVVTGDPVLLRRLTANLIDNAVRYNVPGGSISIETGREGAESVLRVRNSGPVVPPERVEDLFEPFNRLEQRTGSGLGLGLTLVRSIAERHGGRVTATAPTSGGLVVEVRVPGSPRAIPAPDLAPSSAGEAAPAADPILGVP